MLEAREISVSFDRRVVLDDLSFELNAGKIIVLLGANGAGKTTLIRALNGTLPLSAGQIILDGKDVAAISRREIALEVAVVAQENETRFPITVLEFVLSGRFVQGSSFGWESGEDVDQAFAALEQCDLNGYESRLMNDLSGGERQRVVLARAVAAGTRILLLDEPTANLDIAHQALMFRLVRARCDQNHGAAIVITHDLNLASAFADEIILLKDGGIAARGKPADVLTEQNIQRVFGVRVLLDQHPATRKVRVTAIY